MANLDYISHQTLVDANGVPYASAKINYYETGSVTPKTTYSEAGLTSANANPVVCDANGVVPEVYLLAGRYKRAVTTSAGVSLPQFDVDPLDASVEMIVSASPPSPAYPFLEYTDGTSRFRRNAANSAWINMGLVDSVVSGATVSEQLVGTSTSVSATPDSVAALWQRGTDIASAATISLPAAGGRHFNITGTTGISAISSAQGGRTVELKFAGACLLTHNATSFILPGAANFTTAAGDVWEFTNEAATDASGSNWKCTKVTLASGAPIAIGTLLTATQADMETATSTVLAVTPGRQHFHPGVAKCWAIADFAAVLDASYNVTSATDTGAGRVTITIANDFSSANYSVVASATAAVFGTAGTRVVTVVSRAAGSFELQVTDTTPTATDAQRVSFAAFGDI